MGQGTEPPANPEPYEQAVLAAPDPVCSLLPREKGAAVGPWARWQET